MVSFIPYVALQQHFSKFSSVEGKLLQKLLQTKNFFFININNLGWKGLLFI